jgi:hypothetical protein
MSGLLQRARGLRPNSRGKANKSEQRYAAHLELLKRAGEVLWYDYEPMRFRLAGSTFYCPDFIVMRADQSLEAHEIKGFWQEAARVRIKVAADKFPLKFIAITEQAKKLGGGYKVEEF